MKTMTCKQLGGACSTAFQAETFEEMAELSKKHAMEMKQDTPHIEALQKMAALMQEPEKVQSWFAAKRQEFETLPHN